MKFRTEKFGLGLTQANNCRLLSHDKVTLYYINVYYAYVYSIRTIVHMFYECIIKNKFEGTIYNYIISITFVLHVDIDF